jgi:hypothetical protein
MKNGYDQKSFHQKYATDKSTYKRKRIKKYLGWSKKGKFLLLLFWAITTSHGFAATPQYIQVFGILSPSNANGVYTKSGTFKANIDGMGTTDYYYDYWSFSNGGTTYYLYLHQYSANSYYWNIDNDMVDDNILFYNSDNSEAGYLVNAVTNAPIGAPVSPDLVSGWTNTYGTGIGTPIVTIYNPITPPTVTTQAVSSISTTTATGNGNITALGSPNPTAHGVCWNISGTPTTSDSKTDNGAKSSTGAYTASMTSLSPFTTYYVRAFATNTGGTSYGSEVSFTTSNVTVTFTDGSGFATNGTKGNSNQVLGRFRLAGDVSGSSLTAASIKLNGTRTGLSNLKLWLSTDATFGGDTQMGSTVAADPGDGASVSFSGFSGSVGTAGTYFFLTGDLDAGASGKTRGILTASGSLTLNKGTLSGGISDAPLSSADVSLPVELITFSARAAGRSIILNWITESETDNLGFILERSGGTGVWVQIASYQFQDGLRGQGNTSSRTEYTFTDETVEPGKDYSYRLSDVSTRGEVALYSPITVRMDQAPEKTEMDKAYPNPFNPQTFIGYRLSEDARVEISVYDLLGRRVKALFNGRQSAGSYHVYWNATDDAGNRAPSGGYIIQMITGKTSQNQKVLLMK